MSGKKKYCFVSNYLTPHQLPFCLAMVKKPDVQFIFIETEKLPEERIKLGYPVLGEKYDFVLNAKNSDEAYASALDIVNESDVVIIGSAPDKFIKARLKENKLTFRFSERIFKKRYHDPLRWIKYTLKNYKYRTKNLYYLLSSAYAAHDYKRCGVKTDKMFKWGYFPKTHKERVCIERCKNSCLWIGRFLDWKHADDAIDAIIRLNREGYNVKLDLIGTGEREESLKQLVIINNAERYVNFLGSKPNEEVFEHMCRSEIFLFTSDYNEGWGAVLNEAMDSGLAVVASHAAGSVPFMVKHGENGLIYRSGDNESLCESLKTLLSDEELKSKLSKNAFDALNSEWNAENAVDKLICFCNSFFDGDIENGICESGVLSRAQAIPQKKMYKMIVKGE